MKKSSNWMVSEDDRILEYLDREGTSTWWQIACDCELTGRLVRTRLRVLARADWVAHHKRDGLDDLWSITTWGLAYLAGHVDADLVRPLPALRPSYATRPGEWAGF